MKKGESKQTDAKQKASKTKRSKSSSTSKSHSSVDEASSESSPRNTRGSNFKKFDYVDKKTKVRTSHEKKPVTSKIRLSTSPNQRNNKADRVKNSAGKDSIHYKILTNRSHKDINLPGTTEHFTPHQPRIDYYDIFYMETRMRGMLDEILTPIQLGIKDDKIKYS